MLHFSVPYTPLRVCLRVSGVDVVISSSDIQDLQIEVASIGSLASNRDQGRFPRPSSS